MASLGYAKNIKKWRVRWRATSRIGKNRGEVYSGSRSFLEKRQAVAFWADIEKQEQLYRTGEADLSESLATAIEEFYRHIKRFTPRTQGHYKMVITKFAASLGGVVNFAGISESHIRAYLNRVVGINRTHNAHLTPIKSFCRYCSNLFNVTNPADKIKMLREDPPESRFLTAREVKLLLAEAKGEAYNRLAFLANTGLRASEIGTIRTKDVRPDSFTVIGKGRKRRTIPLNATAKKILQAKISNSKPNIPIFMLKNSVTGVNRFTLYTQMTLLCQKAGIERAGPHALRHYFATQLLLKGVSVQIVSKILGHSSSRITEQIYSHILPKHLKGVTDCLD